MGVIPGDPHVHRRFAFVSFESHSLTRKYCTKERREERRGGEGREGLQVHHTVPLLLVKVGGEGES